MLCIIRNRPLAAKKLISLVEKLPYFKVDNLKLLKIKPAYLRIILSRYSKKEEFIRLKKGVYTTRKFIDKMKMDNSYSFFLESLSGGIYPLSYLSLEYVLYENNLLTEAPVNFTLITKNKIAAFSNKLGSFIYRKIRDELFCGFEIIKRGEMIVYKAVKAKALFDFLYLGKNVLSKKETIGELRLNLEELSSKDIRELKKYIRLEGSKKMGEIYLNLLELTKAK